MLALVSMPCPIAQGIKCFFKRLAPFHETGRQGDNTDDPTEIQLRQRHTLADNEKILRTDEDRLATVEQKDP